MKVSQLKENIRNIVRKKLSEAVIDVPNPATETPQTKKAKIDLARRTTGNKNLGTEKDPVEFIEETGDQPHEYPMSRIWKMSRAELIDFLNLPPDMARSWSDGELLGGALELADDRSEYEDTVDEADYIDDDDVIHEDVEDIDDKDPTFKDYDSIYEAEISGEFEANVGSGHRGLSVKLHPMDQRLIVISQDNGQKVVVDVSDVYELINTLKGLA
jgi:hypothetical protein